MKEKKKCFLRIVNINPPGVNDDNQINQKLRDIETEMQNIIDLIDSNMALDEKTPPPPAK